MIFVVPAEGGKDHADIYPRDSHARDVRLDVPEQRLWMQWQDIEVPKVGGIWVGRIALGCWEARTMRSTVDVGSVFYLHGFLDTCDQAPELAFDIVLCDGSRAVEHGIERHPIFEISLLKVRGLFLECLERVETTFFETELAIADKASWAIPLRSGAGLEWRVNTRTMVGKIATLADGKPSGLFCFAAILAALWG